MTVYVNGTQRKETPHDHWIVTVADKKDRAHRETALIVPSKVMLHLISTQPKRGFETEDELMKWTAEQVHIVTGV